jgi:hypothetical protein
MLMHHSAEDYNIAASIAATEARGKFEAEIERGKSRAIAVLEQIETQVPTDRVVPAKGLNFRVADGRIKVRFNDRDETEEGFHRHAVGQVAGKLNVPLTYIDRLTGSGEWGQELIADSFNRIIANSTTASGRFLTRSVNDEVRGFLSDSYRRLDSRPIVDSFIQTMQKFGAVPLDGFALDTKIAIKAALPYVFEPVPNEVMIFGVALENSDFGNGALSIRSFVERLWCTNRAISTEDLRKIHLGARLGENLQLSQRTYELDTQTMASAAEDIVTQSISAENVNRYMGIVKQANEEKVSASQVSAFLKKHLTKQEAADTTEAFNSAEVEMMPAGQTRWRLSNAISWIANSKIEDEGRKLEVMRIAGAALDGGNIEAAAA